MSPSERVYSLNPLFDIIRKPHKIHFHTTHLIESKAPRSRSAAWKSQSREVVRGCVCCIACRNRDSRSQISSSAPITPSKSWSSADLIVTPETGLVEKTIVNVPCFLPELNATNKPTKTCTENVETEKIERKSLHHPDSLSHGLLMWNPETLLQRYPHLSHNESNNWDALAITVHPDGQC